MIKVQEVNTLANFHVWVSMIVPNEKFNVESDDRIKSVTISEVNNEMATTRIEMSAYSFPQFFMWESNRKVSYNQALLMVLNRLIAESNYINEISDGLKVITDHRIYQIGTNANSVAKDMNSYVLVDNDFNSNFDVSKKDIRDFADKLPVQPASEKSVGDGILVLSNDSIYTGVGYNYKDGVFTSLFPNKSNLPARLKSFMLPTSVALDHPSENIFKDGDENTMECLVLFVKPGKERHVSGEVWIEKNRFRDVTFTQTKRVWYTDTNMKVDQEIFPQDARIMTPFGPNHQFNNALTLKCVDKNPFYMRVEVCYSLNEARITSQTGMKGYSSVQGNIGELYIPSTDGNGDGIILKPDMVCGPSSIKGKVNQIRLAQAAYVAKYIYGYTAGMLDSMDVDLINRLASECPVGYWSDQNGCQHECYYGLVHVAFTDPSVQYSRNSKMAFQFEMLKLAMLEYPDLADAILDSRDDDKLDIVRELVYLQESLGGNVMTKGVKVLPHTAFNNLRNPKSITVHRINSTEILPVENYLLDPERKAFILQTSKGERVYIPSGKVLNSFQSAGANGQWLYDTVVVQLSRIFSFRNRNLDGLTKAVNRYILTIGNRVVLYPELLGVNMKQTTLYDHEMSVSVPTKNLLAAKKEIYGDQFEDWETIDLYAIVVRNPA